MGPHHEKKIKPLIYPTLTFSALTTRLRHPFLRDLFSAKICVLRSLKNDELI